MGVMGLWISRGIMTIFFGWLVVHANTFEMIPVFVVRCLLFKDLNLGLNSARKNTQG
jgi:hypothetical protein